MPIPVKGFLPKASVMQNLSDEKFKEVMKFSRQQEILNKAYAAYGLTCGLISFLASLGAFIYLAKQGFGSFAGLALGAGVVAIISRMIQGRTGN